MVVRVAWIGPRRARAPHGWRSRRWLAVALSCTAGRGARVRPAPGLSGATLRQIPPPLERWSSTRGWRQPHAPGRHRPEPARAVRARRSRATPGCAGSSCSRHQRHRAATGCVNGGRCGRSGAVPLPPRPAAGGRLAMHGFVLASRACPEPRARRLRARGARSAAGARSSRASLRSPRFAPSPRKRRWRSAPFRAWSTAAA